MEKVSWHTDITEYVDKSAMCLVETNICRLVSATHGRGKVWCNLNICNDRLLFLSGLRNGTCALELEVTTNVRTMSFVHPVRRFAQRDC